MTVSICRISNAEPVVFAAEELKKYLQQIDPELYVDIRAYQTYRPKEGTLWLLCGEECAALAPAVEDRRFDDAYAVKIKGVTGYLAGTNESSVLFSVYALLKKLGCKWIRPGKQGELIPQKQLTDLSADFAEKASYRFRGINYDDKTSEECASDFIDWMPKEGLNHYYVEGLVPARYFSHLGDIEDGEAVFQEVARQARRRGLKRHAVGHGWTMLAAGFEDLSKYFIPDASLTEQQRSCIALRGGKRTLYRDDGFVMGTQLCYSQEKLRTRMIDEIVAYLKENPTVDYLHFWLADGVNNHCECEACAKMRPSDWYVMILNDLDKRLTQEKIDSRIVCLIYVDLLWPPEKFKVENPDRFILMFAPITRTYDTSYASAGTEAAEMKPYVRNQLEFPRSAAENSAYLKVWQEQQLRGDSFIFDYHLMWNQYKAPGYRNLSRVIYDDMVALQDLGLGGSVSCEIPVCQIPHDFPHRIMARTLWTREVDYDAEERAFFEENFGEDWEKAFTYLDEVTKAFKVIYDYYKPDVDSKNQEQELANATQMAIAKIRPVILSNMNKEDLHSAQRLSWELLSVHTEFVLEYARAYTAKYADDDEQGKQHLEAFNRICDRIGQKYPQYFGKGMAKFSVAYYYDEIRKDGPNVVLL